MLVKIIVLLCFSVTFITCQSGGDVSTQIENKDIQLSNSEFFDPGENNVFVCDYMGQKTPGDTPVKFAPDIISTKKMILVLKYRIQEKNWFLTATEKYLFRARIWMAHGRHRWRCLMEENRHFQKMVKKYTSTPVHLFKVQKLL